MALILPAFFRVSVVRFAGFAAGRVLAMLSALVFAHGVAAGATYVATPLTYLGLLRTLNPGDTLVLSAGRYLEGLPLHRIAGMPEQLIVIRGPQSQPSARFVARRGAHTVSIVNSAHETV